MDEKEAEARPVMGTIFLVIPRNYGLTITYIPTYNTPVWGSLRSPNYPARLRVRVMTILTDGIVLHVFLSTDKQSKVRIKYGNP